jgi:putative membrane protein
MKVKRIFTPEREKRVEEAIGRAEGRTSGEIVPMVVDQSDAYLHVDFIGALILQFAAFLAAVWLLPTFDYLSILAVQVLGLVVGFLAFRYLAPLKRICLSPKIAEEEVFEKALRVFRQLELNRTAERTGILILVSLLEHRVQVLADSGINARVKPGTWDEVVEIVLAGIKGGDVCQGLCDAIDRCGEILAKEFPVQPDDVNELPDRLHKD